MATWARSRACTNATPRAVFSLALKLLADREAAEEIVQETFIKLWQRPDSYSVARGRLIAWLLGVAHHRAIDRLRRRQLEQRYGASQQAADPSSATAILSRTCWRRCVVRR